MRLRIILAILSVLLLFVVAACQPTSTITTGTPIGGVTPPGELTPTAGSLETSSPEAAGTAAPTEKMETPSPEMTSTLEMTGTPAITGTETVTAMVTLTTTPVMTGTMSATLTSQELMPHGEEVFTANCSLCHGANGQGTGSYPALAGNPDVTASVPMTITQFVVHGQNGQHNFGDKLSDLDIAAVLTYVRNSWGNSGAPVSEQDVQAARQNPVVKPTP